MRGWEGRFPYLEHASSARAAIEPAVTNDLCCWRLLPQGYSLLVLSWLLRQLLMALVWPFHSFQLSALNRSARAGLHGGSVKLVAELAAVLAQGRSFVVEVPPPAAGHAEFVVLRARYDAGVRRCWEVGDQCQVRRTSVLCGSLRSGLLCLCNQQQQ